MHDYAVFGHSRTTIGRWLGVSSIVFSGAIYSFLVWFHQLTGFHVFAGTLTTATVYFILHWIFNKYVWKLPFFKIPDLNGVWSVRGTTLDENSCAKYEWEADIDIEQNWEQIVICLKTKQSSSNSYTATLSKCNGSREGWLLSYSYNNNPNVDQYHELNSHKGYCEILFNKEITNGVAAYFNSNGRRTFGRMELNRKL